MFFAQITDTHIEAPEETTEESASGRLKAVVENINALPVLPEMVLVTGDLTKSDRDLQYQHAKEILDRLQMPYFTIPGNHDTREALKKSFRQSDYLQNCQEFIQYTIDDYPLRFIALDSLIPNQIHGELCTIRLNWLQEELVKSAKPTVLFMHHPPIFSGIQHMDYYGCRNSQEFFNILQQHRHVIGILCGHYHRTIITHQAHVLISVLGSSYRQLLPSLKDIETVAWTKEPPVYGLYRYNTIQGLLAIVMSA